MPARLKEEVIRQVQTVWAENPSWTGVQVHQAVKRLNRDRPDVKVEIRRVQQIIAEAKIRIAGQPFEPFSPQPCSPWEKGASPETMAFLMPLDAVCVAIHRRNLYHHEAGWGKRLRVLTEGLSRYDQYCFVHLYSQREVGAYHLQEPEPYTRDLDAVLQYRPWVSPEANVAYEAAEAIQGIFIYPGIPGFEGWVSILEPPKVQQEPSPEWQGIIRFWMGQDSVFPAPIIIT